MSGETRKGGSLRRKESEEESCSAGCERRHRMEMGAGGGEKGVDQQHSQPEKGG